MVHEVVKGEYVVGVRLSASGGTSVSAPCEIKLTNKCLYITSKPTTYTVVGKGDHTFTGVQIPMLQCQPHRFIQPWFGPYKWETQVAGQLGIEPQSENWTVLLTFNDGGAFEYRKTFLLAFAEERLAAQEGMEEVLPAYTE